MSAPDLRDRLARALAVPAVVSAYLFGSAAEDREHRDSDVDVGVLLDRRVLPRSADRFEMRLRLSGALTTLAGRDRPARPGLQSASFGASARLTRAVARLGPWPWSVQPRQLIP
jgi:predicted nucleotidyltransferase